MPSSTCGAAQRSIPERIGAVQSRIEQSRAKGSAHLRGVETGWPLAKAAARGKHSREVPCGAVLERKEQVARRLEGEEALEQEVRRMVNEYRLFHAERLRHACERHVQAV